MRLFRSRSTALLEQHLERNGLDRTWWPSAKAAIGYCEQRDWFAPVSTAAGPVHARTVIRLLKLEPFVEGTIDWDADPNPFLNDPAARYFFDKRFEEVAGRWEEAYAEERNPTPKKSDVHQALLYLRRLAALVPDEGTEVSQDALNTVQSIGLAGYCWRLAEEQTQGMPNEEYLQLVADLMDSLMEVPFEAVSRDEVLYRGACECANRSQKGDFFVGRGCPTGFALQFDFFKRAFDWVSDGLTLDSAIVSTPELWYAFTFGVALRDVERWLDQAAHEPH
jgi:hypothetical protein